MLNQVMLEYPLAMFSELEVHPILNGDVALGQWQAMLQAMAASQPPTG